MGIQEADVIDISKGCKASVLAIPSHAAILSPIPRTVLILIILDARTGQDEKRALNPDTTSYVQ